MFSFLKKENIQLALIVCILFLATLNIAYVTPLQSDDFYFAKILGLDFTAHQHFYFSHSGRVVANTIACIILAIPSQLGRALICSACFIGYCYLISLIPSKALNIKYNPLLCALVFFSYWGFNTKLGETTFWIVGSATYLWPNFFIVLFIVLFLKYKNTSHFFTRLMLFISAILAGCSNENTSVTLIVTFIGILFLLKKQDESFQIKKQLPYLIGMTIGAAVLVLCPGNYQRLVSSEFNKWRAMSFLGKIIFYLRRTWRGFLCFLPLIALMLMQLYAVFKTNSFDKNRNYLNWSLLFIGATLVSLGVLIASPVSPLRVFNGTLTFLLIAFVFLFSCEISHFKTSLIVKGISIASLFSLFFISFILMNESYRCTFIQGELRTQSIMHHKNKGDQIFSIPNFYFPRLLTKRNEFDTYHNHTGMAKYYDVKEIKIISPVDFDYSVISTGKKMTLPVKQNSDLTFFIPSYYRNSQLLLNKGVVVIDITNLSIPENTALQLVLLDKHKNTRIVSSKKTIELFGKLFTGFEMESFELEKYSEIFIKLHKD